jgi:hypothetical protein
VAVNNSGRIFGYSNRPAPKNDIIWDSVKDSDEIANVGSFCPDWQTLIFERPEPEPESALLKLLLALRLRRRLIESLSKLLKPGKPVLPTITADEWKAIRTTIVIEHSNTKRKITGPFSVCGSYDYLRSISEQILDETENSGYGWIQIDGGSKAIPNTPPSGWDE